jgi:hypothetical protein
MSFSESKSLLSLRCFLRSWLQRLIDRGAPYVERASKLNLNLKYDFAIAHSLQGGAVSFGELFSHSVSLRENIWREKFWDQRIFGRFPHAICPFVYNCTVWDGRRANSTLVGESMRVGDAGLKIADTACRRRENSLELMLRHTGVDHDGIRILYGVGCRQGTRPRAGLRTDDSRVCAMLKSERMLRADPG